MSAHVEDRPTPEAIAALVKERWPEYPLLRVTVQTKTRLAPGITKAERRFDLSREPERARTS